MTHPTLTLAAPVTPADAAGCTANHDDRRDARRADRRAVAAFDPATGRTFAGTTRDTSRGGLCVEVPVLTAADATAFRPGARLMVSIGGAAARNPEAAALPIDARWRAGRIVWARPALGPGRASVVCGVEFAATPAASVAAAAFAVAA